MKYKLNKTLYSNGYDVDECKYNEDYVLFARKGQIFDILLLTDELREEYVINDKMWGWIAITPNKYSWFLFKDGDKRIFDWFDEVEEHK